MRPPRPLLLAPEATPLIVVVPEFVTTVGGVKLSAVPVKAVTPVPVDNVTELPGVSMAVT